MILGFFDTLFFLLTHFVYLAIGLGCLFIIVLFLDKTGLSKVEFSLFNKGTDKDVIDLGEIKENIIELGEDDYEVIS